MNDAPSSRPQTVLVVEDDRDLVKLIDFCLVRDGFQVRHAADGEQALQEFDTAPRPDLVVLDVMMPYRNGYELLANLRKRPEWGRVPVIMLTSRGTEEDVVRGLDLGANDYLTKPFRPAELVARIRKLLRRSPEAAE